MSMATLNIIQFMQLFAGYLVFTVGFPALVFYHKVKHFSGSVRFLTYFTVGNFYVINLVQTVELLHISSRWMLLAGTFGPVILLTIKIYHIPAGAYTKKILEECQHYILRELGWKTFLLHRWQEIKIFLQVIRRNLWRLLKENLLDIPFLLLTGMLIWKVCGPGLLHHWGFGASDTPVHNYWINGLIENNIYIAGIYPMGMHCMLYFLSTILDIPVYVTLRLFWLVQYSMIAGMILAFLKAHCKTRALPYLGILFFVGAKYFSSCSYIRYGETLPQEFGMLFILPSVFFLMGFFQTRCEELKKDINKIRCTSSWYLIGFAMSFSLTLTSHFYDTIIGGIICLCIAISYGYWFWKKEYFARILLAGILSLLMAVLPMAAAFLTGKPLQGSMYWAMSLIGMQKYTDLIFGILCIGVLAVTAGGIIWIVRGIRRGTISSANKKITQYSRIKNILFTLCSLVPAAGILLVGWKYRTTILGGSQAGSFALPDMNWMLYGIGGAVLVGILLTCLSGSMQGSAILAMVLTEVILGLLLVSKRIGWPVLMDDSRVSVYFAYLIPVVIVMTLNGAINLAFPDHLPKARQVISLCLTILILFGSTRYAWIRKSFGGGELEMNEAILCTTNIMKENEGNKDSWTIVSANDELHMIEEYGRHTEISEFLENMENWNPEKEITIPTEKVYFYIEKKPLNYADGYKGTIPEVSEEEAKKALPNGSGLTPYNGVNRAVTMSRMYYWAQKFRELYPNELKVYYEDDRFVCYCMEQNVYRLYNFAIDYGYNS